MKPTVDQGTAEQFMDFSDDWFMQVDGEGTLNYISTGVRKITGFAPEEFLVRKSLLKEILDPSDREKFPELFSFRYTGEHAEPLEFKIICKDGSVRWITQRIKALFDASRNPSGWLIINHDSTMDKQAARKLFRMTQIVEQSAEAIAIVDTSGTIEYVNHAFEDISGYSLKEAQSLNIPTLISSAGRDEEFAEMRAALQAGKIWRGQNRFHKRDGTVFYLDSVIFPLKNEAGTVLNYVKISRDITNIKKTEEKLKESEEKNRAILNLQPDLIFIQKKDGTYLDYYASHTDALYIRPKQFLGRKMEDFFPAENVKQFLYHSAQACASGGVETYEYTLVVRGEKRHYEARIIPFGEDRILSIVRDTTEKILREQEQLKYRKLESVGLLAGGIAHDFNNIITGVLGNIELAKLEFSPEHTAYNYLERAKKGLQRATGLTKQLLTFARGGEPVMEIVDLERLLRETVLFNLSGSNVKAVFTFDENLYRIKADRGQIEQVFSNLVINAKQAMPEGGKLLVAARNSGKRYVQLLMQDEGTGIPREFVDKIFDPYFTTKQTGSGLGLSTVYSIIRKHKGTIHVQSEGGKGTLFTLKLPAEGRLTVPAAEKKPDRNFLPGNTRILIMDDEDMVRSVASSLLKALGCSVDGASEGSEALAKYRAAQESGHPYDMLFMDLTIPGGMGGRETMEELLNIDPGVQAVVMSGYSNDPVMAHFTEYGFCDRVVKPFSLDSLKRVLTRLSP